MADFLGRLAERTLGLSEVVQPRVAPLFASSSGLELSEVETNEAVPSTQEPLSAMAIAPLAFRPEFPQDLGTPPRLVGEQASADASAPMTPVIGPARSVSELVPTPARESLSTNNSRQAEPPLLVPSAAIRPGPSIPAPPQESGEERGLMTQFPGLPFAEERPLATRAEPPTVHVTIGRIDVRAVIPPPQQRPPAAPEARPTLTLDEYVKQRREGVR